MQYVFFALLIIFSVYAPKSKVLTFLNIAFMWILVTFNYYRPDYIHYIRRYNTGYQKDEIGYTIISKIFRYFNMPFNCMIGFIVAINLFLIYLTYKRMTDKTALAMAFYMVNSFYDLIQIRNFTMMAIIIYCIRFLDVNNGGKKNASVWKYCVGVFIASNFHSVGIIYLAIPFIMRLSIKKFLFLSMIGSVIIFQLSFMSQNINSKFEFYFRDFSVMWKANLFIIMYFIFLLSGLYAYHFHRSEKISYIQAKNISRASIYSFMYNILLFRNLNFHRIFRNIMPLLYVQYTEYFNRKLKIVEIFFLFSIIIMTVCGFFYNLKNEICFFEYNYIFDLLFHKSRYFLL